MEPSLRYSHEEWIKSTIQVTLIFVEINYNKFVSTFFSFEMYDCVTQIQNYLSTL